MSGEKILNNYGKIQVPDFPIIPFIEGDGTGPDIWAASVRVFDAAVEKAYGGKRKIEWKEVLAGEKAFKETGKYLPEETLDIIHEHLVAIKGPLTTPVGGGIRSLNVALRQILDLYVNLRQVKYFEGVPSSVKDPTTTDMVIFRENSEDIYASTGIKPISKEGSSRLVRGAIQYAVRNKQPSVSLVHKGNIMKSTEGQFKQWGYELAEREFGDLVFTWAQYDHIAEKDGTEAADQARDEAIKAGKILIKDVIADAFLQQILTRPADYSVIASMNLNDDYISDAPEANINYETGHAIFEATHGTAPKYAKLDQVNPASLILSGVMMLDYMAWNEAAELIVSGLQLDGVTPVSCSGFGTAIIENM